MWIFNVGCSCCNCGQEFEDWGVIVQVAIQWDLYSGCVLGLARYGSNMLRSSNLTLTGQVNLRMTSPKWTIGESGPTASGHCTPSSPLFATILTRLLIRVSVAALEASKHTMSLLGSKNLALSGDLILTCIAMHNNSWSLQLLICSIATTTLNSVYL